MNAGNCPTPFPGQGSGSTQNQRSHDRPVPGQLLRQRSHGRIPRPADPDAAKRVTAHLDRYAFAWDYSEPPGPA